MDLTQLLAFTLQNEASDLHLSAGSVPIIRKNGTLKRIKSDPLSTDDIREMLYSVMTEDQRAEYEKKFELDFAISLGDKARFRVNGFTTRLGTSAVFRAIPHEIPTFEQLDLPPVIRRFANLEKGLVLVTGPTGSGKSTTLAALINYININKSKHILTIEDPVEFFHTSQKSLVNHREVGTDTHNFSAALRSALREDPDVILVGEMRDYETIRLALTAAETGHLVLGTLHSNSATKTVDRLIEVFPTGDKEMVRAMVSGSLQGVVAQTLLKRADGSGRVGAFEILVGTNAARNLIRENQVAQLYSVIQTGSRYGMITMEDSVNQLLESGIIDATEAKTALLRVADEGGDADIAAADQAEGGGDSEGQGAATASNAKQNTPDGSSEGYSF